jgi:hypothetical protein
MEASLRAKVAELETKVLELETKDTNQQAEIGRSTNNATQFSTYQEIRQIIGVLLDKLTKGYK